MRHGGRGEDREWQDRVRCAPDREGPNAGEPRTRARVLPGKQRAATKARIGRSGERDERRIHENIRAIGAREEIEPIWLKRKKARAFCDFYGDRAALLDGARRRLIQLRKLGREISDERMRAGQCEIPQK